MGYDPDTSHPVPFRFPISSRYRVFILLDSFYSLVCLSLFPVDIGFIDRSSSYQFYFLMIKEIFCSNEIHRDLRVLNSDVCSLLGWLLKLPLIFGSPVELSVLSFLFALFFFVRLLY